MPESYAKSSDTMASSDHSRLFVLSGGPGAGKTTVLDELGRLGYRCVPEVARQIIQEQVRSGGTALPWSDREAYTKLMLERSINSYLEHASTAMPVFFDRGVPDTLGYANLIGLKEREPIEEACQRYRYARIVFVAPPWDEIYTTDGERKQDFAEAEKTFRVVSEVYRQCGYEIQVLPKATPVERARFVLEVAGCKAPGSP